MKPNNFGVEVPVAILGSSTVGGAAPTTGPSGVSSGTDGTTTVTPITSITVPPGGIVDNGGGDAGFEFLTRLYGAQAGLVTVASSGSAYAVDVSAGNTWDITLDDDCALTFANWPASGVDSSITLVLRQGGAGSFTVTWPAEVDWQDTDGTGGGAAPTLWTAVGASDTILLTTLDGGTTVGASQVRFGGGAGGLTGGTPALTLGTANAAGAASTGIRTDATILAFDATVPTTQDYDDAPAAGSATVAARRDHLHGMPAAASGSVPDGTDPGDILAWDGGVWDVLGIGSDDQTLIADSGEALGLRWGTGGGSGNVTAYSAVEIDGLSGWADALPGSPSAYDDEFNTLSGWTTLGTLDTSNVTDWPSILHVARTAGAWVVDGLYKTGPSTPYTVTVKMNAATWPRAYIHAGILITESSPGKLFTFGQWFESYNACARSLWTNRTTRSAYAYAYASLYYGAMPQYYQLVVASGSDITCNFSYDGYLWQTPFSSVDSGLTPANVGIFISDYYGLKIDALFDWIRFT